MKVVHCPICDASFVVEFDGMPYKESTITIGIKAHIARHSIESILERINDIWADEYNEVMGRKERIEMKKKFIEMKKKVKK
jgi:hypothetical protein